MNAGKSIVRKDPCFLVYESRSGSTYLANILVRHPNIGLAPESKFIRWLWKWSRYGNKRVTTSAQLVEIFDLIYSLPNFTTWQLPRDGLFEQLLPQLPLPINEVARQIILMKCRQANPDCVVWGLKNGGWYAQNIPVLRSLFPEAKFIHIVRDGRAVFASEKKAVHPVTGLPFQTGPLEAALGWKTLIVNFDKWARPEFALEVRYEELLTEPSRVIGQMLSFLGMHADVTTVAEMLQPRRAFQIHEQYSHLHSNVGKPAQLARITAWCEELSQEEIRLFEKIAGRVLRSKGYALMYPRSNWDDIDLLRYEGMHRVYALARAYLKMLVVKYADMRRVWA